MKGVLFAEMCDVFGNMTLFAMMIVTICQSHEFL